ncbi:anaphase-promoting complex subunit 2 [Acrodontium crateriforme]|uniref:Anaphase-promoting complex subunit 2 n=1 Tax=Acrodontium crateriforme TaxID=150365 RepID=A0AAQ3M398_9PEZI|nr:anaphase-promoting complex subunit 2 [Acrodontium crateriforme]
MATASISAASLTRREDIFASVFPPASFTTPTPEATPTIGVLSSPGKSFGGFNHTNQVADGAVSFNRNWSTATRFLTLTASEHASHDDRHAIREATAALQYLWNSPSSRSDLVKWYNHEVSVHYSQFVLPSLGAWHNPIASSNALYVVRSTIDILENAQELYNKAPSAILNVIRDASQRSAIESFCIQTRQGMQRLFLHSLPRQRLQKTLANVMYQLMETSIQQSRESGKCAKSERCSCKVTIDDLSFTALHTVGLGGNLGERAFAHAVHKLLDGPAVERRCFEVDWSGHESVVDKLREWIQSKFAPFVEQCLSKLTGNASLQLTESEITQFVTMAALKLGRQRTLSLFDYVKSWPHSQGAVLDIKEYLFFGSLTDKAHVCSSFTNQLQNRFLHAGVSTNELLSIYINVIHTFRLLDARGVLLDKVATPIRNYLRARDDTVSIIAASFLADVDKNGAILHSESEKVCIDIALEVARSNLEERQESGTLNWNDMDWVPDPIDAGPQYKSSKSEDVVAYILGLFEQADFIKEVTNVLAQHLLHMVDSEYVKETRLVELFKTRLDASKLQAAEVMLKDVRDSASLNRKLKQRLAHRTNPPATPREIQAAIPQEGIPMNELYERFSNGTTHTQFLAIVKLVANKRDNVLYPKRSRLPAESPVKKTPSHPEFNLQVLSSFFWPEMQSRDYEVPSGFYPLQEHYSTYFQQQGGQRKLQFKPALARCTVELELEDRQVREVDIPAWRGSVIDAFASERGDAVPITYNSSDGLTPQQLMDALRMDEELVMDALNFWTAKRVLYQCAPGIYAVLESLDMDTGADEHQEQEPAESISAVKTQDAMFQDNAPTFSIFIANMLRNGGAKEIGGMMGITSMLKMVLPTFTYGEEEVQYLLAEMEGRGEVTRNGDLWSAK